MVATGAATPSGVGERPVAGARFLFPLLLALSFLGALDQNVIVTTLSGMAGDTSVPLLLLRVGQVPAIQFDRASWLVTGYLLGYVAVLPLMGAVSDVYGRRLTLQLALLLFALGSVAAALAGTLPVLVAARVVQALGAGALLPVSLAAAADWAAPRRRGRSLGLIAAAAEVGAVCGPLYGAAIAQQSGLGWRLIFWLNVPIVALLLPLTLLLPARGVPRSLDYRGALLLGLALAALVTGSGSSGIFGSAVGGGPANRLFLVGCLALLLLLWCVERGTASPMLPIALLRQGRLVAACAANLLAGVALGVAIVVIPLYAATIQGISSIGGGLLLLRYLAMLAVGAAAGGYLRDRIGPRPTALAGLVAATAGYWLLRAWLVSPPRAPSWPAPMLAGLGLGLVAAPIATVALSVADREQGGVPASLVTAARVIGMMVGLSSLTSYGSWRFHLLVAHMPMPAISANADLAGLQRLLTSYSGALQAKEIIVLQEILAGAGLCCALALLPALFFGGAGSGGSTGVAVVGARAKPRVDRVAALLPVAGLHRLGERDLVHPLDVLEAVHIGYHQPDGIALLLGQRLVIELVAEEHIGEVRLIHAEALGVRSVGRGQQHILRAGVRLDLGQEVAQADAGPGDVRHFPAGHTMVVLDLAGARHRQEVGEAKGLGLLHQAIDLQAIVLGGEIWDAAGGVDLKAVHREGGGEEIQAGELFHPDHQACQTRGHGAKKHPASDMERPGLRGGELVVHLR